MKLKAFICDIDGTVADHTDVRGHYDYDKVHLDKPVKPVIDVVRKLSADWYPVVYMSGRPNMCRDETTKWLLTHMQPLSTNDKLVMRPDYLTDNNGDTSDIRDFRPDFVVKEELYWKHVEPFYDIQFAIDDRPQVLKMWHRLNIPTFAVGTPWLEF
jgi:hypothetical protein